MIEHLEIQTFDELESTQTYAKNELEAGRLSHFTVISAQNQTSGKGRNTKVWQSKKGDVTITIILPATSKDQQVSYVAGVALLESIRAFYPSLLPQLKWVNDVLIDEKKVCGILLEKVNNTLLVGIGVNLGEAPVSPDFNACSLKDYGRQIKAEEFISILLDKFKTKYNTWQQLGFSPIRNIWKKHCYRFGERIKVGFADGTEVNGRFKDIDNDGMLILGIDDKERFIDAGEIFKL